MDELQLIQLVKKGDADSFAALVRRYQERTYHLCLGLLSNAADAEDAAQEAFVKAYRSIKKFQGDSSFSTWLYRIATNHCLDMLRKKTREKKESLEALLEKEGERVEAILSAGKSEGQSLEDRDLIQRILSRLTDDQRALLTLREVQGLSYEEIARILEVSLDGVKTRLYRARQEIEKIAKHFLTPPTSKRM